MMRRNTLSLLLVCPVSLLLLITSHHPTEGSFLELLKTEDYNVTASECLPFPLSQNCSNGNCTLNPTRLIYECLCPSGFTLTPDYRSCEDIDECQDQCRENENVCLNYVGSFRCYSSPPCPEGYDRLQTSRGGYQCTLHEMCPTSQSACGVDRSQIIRNVYVPLTSYRSGISRHEWSYVYVNPYTPVLGEVGPSYSYTLSVTSHGEGVTPASRNDFTVTVTDPGDTLPLIHPTQSPESPCNFSSLYRSSESNEEVRVPSSSQLTYTGELEGPQEFTITLSLQYPLAVKTLTAVYNNDTNVMMCTTREQARGCRDELNFTFIVSQYPGY